MNQSLMCTLQVYWKDFSWLNTIKKQYIISHLLIIVVHSLNLQFQLRHKICTSLHINYNYLVWLTSGLKNKSEVQSPITFNFFFVINLVIMKSGIITNCRQISICKRGSNFFIYPLKITDGRR